MEEVNKFQAVNTAETAEQLKSAIMLCADDDIIEGRTEQFNAKRMCEHLDAYLNHEHDYPNVLTRKWGIRQQAMYIKFYSK